MGLIEQSVQLKPGYSVRTATMDDASTVHGLIAACDIAVVGQTDLTAEELAQDWKEPGTNLATDTQLVFAADGRLVGYAVIADHFRPVTPYFDVYVHPDLWADDQGIGAALMEWCEARARQVFDKVPADARVALHGYTYSTDTFYQNTLSAAGLIPIRHSFHMRINFDGAPQTPVWSDGISVRTFQADEDKHLVLDVLRASFQDHWGYAEQPYEEHYERWLHYWNDDFDPSLWFLAIDGETIAGICLCKPSRGGDENLGWVQTLGVRREYRKRGVGRALLLHAFHDLYQRGKKAVGLGVDASSLTGAVRLYENAGMNVHKRFDLYEKELRPGVEYTTQEAGE